MRNRRGLTVIDSGGDYSGEMLSAGFWLQHEQPSSRLLLLGRLGLGGSWHLDHLS